MTQIHNDIRSIALLSGGTFLLSFLTLIIIAYFFGTTSSLDAYWIAFTLMNVLTFPIHPLREALIPELYTKIKGDTRHASKYFSEALSLIILVSLVGIVIGYLLGPILMKLAVAATKSSLQELAIQQLYWILPALAIFAVSETLNAILTAYHKVVMQSMVRFIGGLSNLGIIIILASQIGTRALPVAFICSQLITLMVQINILENQGLKYSPVWPRSLGIRFFANTGALLINYTASQFYAVYEKQSLTRYSIGIVSSYQYSVSITNVVITLVGITLANALWPRFLAGAEQKNLDIVRSQITKTSKVILLISGLLCSLIWINATPIIKVLLARGAFTEADVSFTSSVLRILVFTAMPISTSLVIGRLLISLHASREIVLTGLSVAFAGICTLTVANIIECQNLAISNWLLANIAGVVIQALLLNRICGGSGMGMVRFLLWFVCVSVVLVIAGITVITIFPVVLTSYREIFEGLLLRSISFSIIAIGLGWVTGLTRVLNYSPVSQRQL